MANKYWVSGTGDWSNSTSWSATSGGFPGSTPPGVGDTAIFDVFSDSGSGNFTVTVDTSVTVDNLTFTGINETITLASAGNLTVTGATNIGADVSTNGVTLSGSPTLGAITITFACTFNINGNTVTATSLVSSLTETRTLAFGTGGVINITGNNGTVCNVTTTGTHTITGSGTVNFTYSGSTGTRTIVFFADTGSEAIDINVTAGSDGFTIGNNTVCKSLNFTGFSGTFTSNDLAIYGSLTISSGMTIAAATQAMIFAATTSQTITTNGKTLDFPVTFNGVGGTWTLQDNMTVGSTRTTNLTAGTLALGSNTLSTGIFNTSNTNARTLNFGTGKIVSTFSSASNTTVINCATLTNATISGTPTFEVTGTGINTYTINWGTTNGGETKAANISYLKTTACTYSSSGSLKNITINSSLATWTSGSNLSCYGNFTVTALSAFGVSNNVVTFAATSGTQDITTAGKTADFPITINCPGATTRLQDALTMGSTRTLIITAGTFNANNQNVTSGLVSSNNSNTRTVTLGSGTWTLSGTGTVWDFASVANLTFNKDSANIVLSNTTTGNRQFDGGGLTYNNLTVGGTTGTSTLTISGSNTFNVFASSKTVAHTIRFTGGTTTTVSGWTAKGSSGNVLTINAVSTTFTLTKTGGGVISGLDYLSITNSTATPSSTWYAGANSTDGGGNTGWIFSVSPSEAPGNMFLLFN